MEAASLTRCDFLFARVHIFVTFAFIFLTECPRITPHYFIAVSFSSIIFAWVFLETPFCISH